MKAKHKRRLFSLVALGIAVMISFTGCQVRKADFNMSGYIEAVLDSNYKAENQMYIGFTNATAAEAAANHITTVSNAAVRFFTKHNLNPSEAQNTALSDLLGEAYKLCSYTVLDRKEVTGGFTVDVSFTPLTNLSDISNQVENMIKKEGDKAYDVGASYINNVIELCRNALTEPTFGSSQTQTIDIRLSDNGELSLNIKLFDKIDEDILPF